MLKRKRPKGKAESFYQELVQRYLSRKYGCVAVRELNFGGPKFDVVGFSPDTAEFHIVECKRAKRPVGVGQTFGQILAYKAMIFDSGQQFLSCFNDALAKNAIRDVDFWIHGARFVESRKIPIRFYVALREEACNRPDILRLMKKDLRGVGIIRINRYGQCKDYIRDFGEKDSDLCSAERVEVPIALPPRPELTAVLEHKGANRNVCSLAGKFDQRLMKMRRQIRSVKHGNYALTYRLTKNFASIRPRKKHLRVSFLEGSGWKSVNISREGQLRRVIRRVRKALERTLE
jgi:hypothetical protein